VAIARYSLAIPRKFVAIAGKFVAIPSPAMLIAMEMRINLSLV
jgi:hypothetical protein